MRKFAIVGAAAAITASGLPLQATMPASAGTFGPSCTGTVFTTSCDYTVPSNATSICFAVAGASGGATPYTNFAKAATKPGRQLAGSCTQVGKGKTASIVGPSEAQNTLYGA